MGGAFWLGQQGAGESPAVAADPRGDLMVAALRSMLMEQRQAVDAAKESAQRDLDALAQQLAELQARAIRIDALGERLVDMVGLDPGEFGFGTPPGQGGPAPADSGVQTQAPDLVRELTALSSRLADRGQELEALERSIIDVRTAQQMHPQGRPVSIGWISSAFGWRSDPVTGRKSFHEGLDFAGKPGSPVFAAAAGIVTFSGVRHGFGNVVEVEHGAGYMTRYAHNRKNLVERGARVSKGQRIALMGSSGRATGTHLHFEVLKDGNPLNPITFIRAQQGRGEPRATGGAAGDSPES
jgi:murein DD-endopeptidase MepM/ murein hydrolase activator NlpD